MVFSNTTPTNCTGNSTCSPMSQHVPSHQTPNYLAQCLPIAIVIVAANGLVFVLFGIKSSLRTPTNYFLFSMAICDFLNGAINIPLFVAPYQKHLDLPDSFHIAVPAVQLLTVALTSYHILAVTAEKYLAITMPFKRRVFVTSRMIFGTIAGIWIISFAFFAVQFSLDPYSVHMMSYNITTLVLIFIVPFAFMAYAYMVMIRTLRQRKALFGQSNNSREKNRTSNDLRCLIVFLSMLTIFAVCWCPWFILRILTAKRQVNLYHIINAYIVVRYLSSAINPILYTLFKTDFSQALKSLVRRKSGQEVEQRYLYTRATSLSVGQRKHNLSTKM